MIDQSALIFVKLSRRSMWRARIRSFPSGLRSACRIDQPPHLIFSPKDKQAHRAIFTYISFMIYEIWRISQTPARSRRFHKDARRLNSANSANIFRSRKLSADVFPAFVNLSLRQGFNDDKSACSPYARSERRINRSSKCAAREKLWEREGDF